VKPYLKNTSTKKGMVEWLKVYALSSSPSTAKNRERERERKREGGTEGGRERESRI
jgi:hypothetical protein